MTQNKNKQCGIFSKAHTSGFKPWVKVMACFIAFCFFTQQSAFALHGNYNLGLTTVQSSAELPRNAFLVVFVGTANVIGSVKSTVPAVNAVPDKISWRMNKGVPV